MNAYKITVQEHRHLTTGYCMYRYIIRALTAEDALTIARIRYRAPYAEWEVSGRDFQRRVSMRREIVNIEIVEGEYQEGETFEP